MMLDPTKPVLELSGVCAAYGRIQPEDILNTP